MTEKSWGWTTGTTNDGASTYTQADYASQMAVIAACLGFEGVAPNYLNAFATTGTSSPISVNTGGAMVDGHPYKNDAAVSVSITTPVSATRIDRITLRADWANHMVRLNKLGGTEGSGVPPAITQTSGTTYDIKLYQVSITTGGVITLTDERVFAQAGGSNALAAATVTAAQIASLVGQRVGGFGLNDWNQSGSSTIAVSSSKIYVGQANWSGSSTSGNVSISFPSTFTYAPLIFVTPTTTGNIMFNASTTTSGATINWSSGATVTNINFMWFAIGQ